MPQLHYLLLKSHKIKIVINAILIVMKLPRKKQQLVKKLQLKSKVLRVKWTRKNSKKKLKLKCKKNLCDFQNFLSYTIV